ncbi:MAG: GDP-mannose 4,6-dehydratase [archaeon]|nr:GDP-mannose 4,6-dehydratase [archaeon]
MEGRTILITGASGFIGAFLCKSLLLSIPKIKIIGVDNNNDYYDVNLKKERLKILNSLQKDFIFIEADISDKSKIDSLFTEYKPSIVVNLAAQAGVRYSIDHPDVYINSNIVGFFNILEACRFNKVDHLIYASSSSIYGDNKKIPYSVEDKSDHPVSLYGATKKTNELFAYSYSKLYNIPATGLRFFTVYGPLGRPDMAYFKFTNKLVKGESIQIFNNGDMYRDFTYVDDIVTGIIKIMEKKPTPNEDNVLAKVYNIGNSSPENLMNFVDILEECLIKEGIIKEKGKRELLPMQPGDVYRTYADVSDLEKDFGFKPTTSLREGLSKFAKWYKEYYCH